MIIAIDGPAGAGKGTISKFLAYHLDFAVIDTGLFYRAFAFSVENASHSMLEDMDYLIQKAHLINLDDLKNPYLRTEAVANLASQIAGYPIIREIITLQIRSLAKQLLKEYKGVVVDGRDVGTVIFKEADVKLFITADANVRATRRQKELDGTVSADSISMIIKERDNRDSTRQASPLEKADGAFLIDTTNLSIDDACQMAYDIVLNSKKSLISPIGL
jgi:cytidylate kinase